MQRLLVPALGGVLAGLAIFYGMRWGRRRSSTDYMEAIVLGDGVISSRSSLVKCLSAMFSIASGASIGLYTLIHASKTQLKIEAYELKVDGSDPQFDTVTITK